MGENTVQEVRQNTLSKENELPLVKGFCETKPIFEGKRSAHMGVVVPVCHDGRHPDDCGQNPRGTIVELLASKTSDPVRTNDEWDRELQRERSRVLCAGGSLRRGDFVPGADIARHSAGGEDVRILRAFR